MKDHPEFNEIMKTTLVSFETGIIEGLRQVANALKAGREINSVLIAELILASEERTKLLAMGIMRPDLKIKPLK